MNKHTGVFTAAFRFWTDPLCPRPLWLEFPTSETTQGELHTRWVSFKGRSQS